MEGDSFVWDIGLIGLLDKHQQVIENETGYIGLSGKMDKIQYSTKHLGIVKQLKNSREGRCVTGMFQGPVPS